jgi:hypothetical protein
MLVRKKNIIICCRKWLPGINLMIWRVLKVGENGQGVVLINVNAVQNFEGQIKFLNA